MYDAGTRIRRCPVWITTQESAELSGVSRALDIARSVCPPCEFGYGQYGGIGTNFMGTSINLFGATRSHPAQAQSLPSVARGESHPLICGLGTKPGGTSVALGTTSGCAHHCAGGAGLELLYHKKGMHLLWGTVGDWDKQMLSL